MLLVCAACSDGHDEASQPGNPSPGAEPDGGADASTQADASTSVPVPKECKLAGPDVVITSRADALLVSSCTSIPGSLTIRQTDLTDLSLLSSVRSIGRTLQIEDNPNLSSIAALADLASVGGVVISNDRMLTSLKGLEQLRDLDRLYVHATGLTSLEGLQGLTSLASLVLQNNPQLADLSALRGLRGEVDVTITGNAVATLTGLEGLSGVGELVVSGNPELASLAALQNVTSASSIEIIGNAKLASLEGLASIENPAGIRLESLPALTSLEGLNESREVGGTIHLKDLALRSFVGLENLTRAYALHIEETDAVDLKGLDNLTSVNWFAVNDNPSLQSLSGLQGLNEVVGQGFRIESNPQLSSIAGLSGLTSVKGEIRVSDNQALRQCEVDALVAGLSRVCDLCENNTGAGSCP